MNPHDQLGFAWRSLISSRLRTLLVILAAAIGVVAVILLTALGEGARQYILGEFSQLGSDLLIVLPGKTERGGGPPGLIFETERDLTLRDVEALRRQPHINAVSSVSIGVVDIGYGSHVRQTTLIGSDASLEQTRKLSLGRGNFLPSADLNEAQAVTVIGRTLADDLFRNASPLGQWLRLGDRRFRVIGVLKKQGTSLGQNLDEVAIIPIASAQSLFNNPALFRILIQAESRSHLAAIEQNARHVLTQLHQGEEDFTLLTQDAVLSTFDQIFKVMTMSVAGIAAISLVVAGIIIMNVMLVSVSQRRTEVGLLMALGAPRSIILRLFLFESLLVSTLGALAGCLLGRGGVAILAWVYPSFPVMTPVWAYFAATGTALGAGVLFGWLPARRAAHLDPVQALKGA